MAKQLERAIEQLEARLDHTTDARAIDELATVRRGLARPAASGAGVALPNVRIGSACKQRWEEMVGDERVRACGGCDRPVFNLSAMTRAEAAAVLATRGLTPCVRFYRRPDGTVMTSDCPTSARPTGRRLAVVAAGATLAATPAALAEPAQDESAPTAPQIETTTPEDADASDAAGVRIDDDYTMGLPSSRSFDGLPSSRSFDAVMGLMIVTHERRPKIEWSVWGRLGVGVGSREPQPKLVARRVTPPEVESTSTSTWEAALAAEITIGVARHGDLRLGAWGEVRTSSDPVIGGELVIGGLPPHPYDSRIGATGSLVIRAGGNDRIVTGAVGFGYVGSFPRYDPWIGWARHMVGARVVVSVNRSIDEPQDWSATIGLELEPLGAARALLRAATSR